MNHSKNNDNFADPITTSARNAENQSVSPGFPVRTTPSRRQPTEVQDAGRIRFGAGLRRPISK
jgi:hypothetical protein